jgi:hypothetical protein
VAIEEWWHDARPAITRTGKNDRYPTRWLGGFTILLAAVGAVVWNQHSDGGLIRALGGVTNAELEAAKHPRPPGPRDAPGPARALPALSWEAGRPVDFDKSGPVPGSEPYVCTLSKVALTHRAKTADQSCELTPAAKRGDPWQISVNRAVCGVMCFAIGFAQ